MPREGVTKAAVQTALEALLARGERPSVDHIRVELGNTGSKTTIQRYLKELLTPDPPKTLSSLSDELVHSLEAVVERLIEETKLRLAAEQPELEEAWRRHAQTEALNRELIASLQKQLTGQLRMLENLHQQKIEMEQRYRGLQLTVGRKEGTTPARSERNNQLKAVVNHVHQQPAQRDSKNEYHDERLVKEQLSLQASVLQKQGELLELYREQERLLATGD